MKIVVLGATGKTGRLLVSEGLRQGHDVIAIARTPARLADLALKNPTATPNDVSHDRPTPTPADLAHARPTATTGGVFGRLTIAAGDVFDPAGWAAAAQGADTLVSGLGIARGGDVTTLIAGAEAVAALHLPKVVWLGSLGLGATGGAAGPLFTPLFNLMLRREIPAKITAENTIRAAGGTVVHAPILGGDEARGAFKLIPAAAYRPPLMFPTITRADVAALMIEEAQQPRFGAETAIFAPRKRS